MRGRLGTEPTRTAGGRASRRHQLCEAGGCHQPGADPVSEGGRGTPWGVLSVFVCFIIC